MTRIVVLALAALALTAAPAAARIVPQKSIRGVELGWSKAQVRAKLGQPDKSRKVPNEILGSVREWTYGKTVVRFGRASGVLSITTRARRQKTARGVGPRSTKAFAKANLPGATCKVEFGADHCYYGKFRAGRTVTDFMFGSRDRVKFVTLGRVID